MAVKVENGLDLQSKRIQNVTAAAAADAATVGLVAINNRGGLDRPVPACFSYFADTADASSAPSAFTSGQATTTVLNGGTGTAWSVSGGFLGLALPLPSSGGSVAYLSTPDLGATVTHVGGRFRFTSGATTTAGTAALAITNSTINLASMPSMSCHFHTTLYNWTLGVWAGADHGNGGETILASGNYSFAAGLVPGVMYEMEAWISGTTIAVRLPDGSVQGPYTNSNIGVYAGHYAFCESYTAANTDAVAQWSHFWCNTGAIQAGSPGNAPVKDAVFGGTVTIPDLILTGPNTPAYGEVLMCITGGGEAAWTTPASIGTTTATATTLAARDGNADISAAQFISGYTTTATAGGTTTLTAASNHLQYLTGTSNQTVTLPVVSTLVLGQRFQIVNLSTGTVTVQSSGANAVLVLAAATSAIVSCVATTGTGAASWQTIYAGVNTASGKALTVNNSLTLAGTDSTTLTFQGTDTYVGRTTTDTLTNKTLTTPTLNGTPTGTGVATAATASTLALRDANANVTTANLLEGYTTTATAAGTTTLTVASNYQQFLTGTSTQTVTLPVTSTLVTGQSWVIANLSTGTVTIQSSGANTVVALPGGSSAIVTCVSTTGTTAASWQYTYLPSLTSADTYTNKRITPRVATTTSASSITINTDTTDIHTVTALAAALTFAAPSGTPTTGQRLTRSNKGQRHRTRHHLERRVPRLGHGEPAGHHGRVENAYGHVHVGRGQIGVDVPGHRHHGVLTRCRRSPPRAPCRTTSLRVPRR
jgi:hypothetical protein